MTMQPSSNQPSSNAPYEEYEDFDHTGPGTLMGRWLRLFWHPVFRSEDLPVDDEHGVQLALLAAHVPDKNREKYLQRRAERAAAKRDGKKRPSVRETAQAVLAGRVRLDDLGPDDVDPPGLGLVMVQDWITQCGQGVIQEDRRKERLGASDATVVMNRKILRREPRALAAGLPLKQWEYDPQECAVAPRGGVTGELKRLEPDRATQPV